MLDIIVPHYKENLATIRTLLASINCQTGIDFKDIKVTVVTDGLENALPFIGMDEYNFDLDYIVRDEELHRPGLTRQYGIDRTNSEYIMFADSDDQLASPFVLKYFLNTIKNNPGIETIFTGYLEESFDGEKFTYTTRDDDVSITCLHGKVYKRSFLNEHNIRFNDLLISEDGAFNFKCVCHCKDSIFNDDMYTYIWKYNPNSLTRLNTAFKNFDVNIRVFGESINGFEAFFDEIINSKISLVNNNIIKPFIESLYVRLNMIKGIPILTDEHKKDLINTEHRINQCYEKYKEYFND